VRGAARTEPAAGRGGRTRHGNADWASSGVTMSTAACWLIPSRPPAAPHQAPCTRRHHRFHHIDCWQHGRHRCRRGTRHWPAPPRAPSRHCCRHRHWRHRHRRWSRYRSPKRMASAGGHQLLPWPWYDGDWRSAVNRLGSMQDPLCENTHSSRSSSSRPKTQWLAIFWHVSICGPARASVHDSFTFGQCSAARTNATTSVQGMCCRVKRSSASPIALSILFGMRTLSASITNASKAR
jgi:hypothetical protein